MLMRLTGMERGRNGLGSFTAYVNGDLQTFTDSPCAPGLQFIGGSCFRAPGTQDTPYGVIPIPLAGPQANNQTAMQLLGGGVTCKTERVDAGPYAYEQNVCRATNGQIVAGADVVAESAYVRGQLANGFATNLTAPTGVAPIANSVRPATPNAPPAAMTSTSPAVVQTGAYASPVGGVMTTRPQVATAVGTSSAAVIPEWLTDLDLPGKLASGVSGNGWWLAAAGVGAFFLLPKLFAGSGR